MLEAARLAGGRWVNRSYPGVRAVEPPKSVGKPPVPDFFGSLGDSLKGSGSSLGTRWEIAGRRPKDSSQEYQRLPDWRNRRRLTHPGWAVEPPIPKNLGTLGGLPALGS
ncbi:hypothetical protein GW17_00043670 [Ensete ventricosum]|nr:hypothetical protein GW17_00043670 [Ensete ventricosum]